MSSEIYVVMGTCGEYSDRREWAVAAYFDKTRAEAHAFEGVKRAKAYFDAVEDSEFGMYDDDALRAHMGDFDPRVHADYTGVEYYVLDVPIREDVP